MHFIANRLFCTRKGGLYDLYGEELYEMNDVLCSASTRKKTCTEQTMSQRILFDRTGCHV
jgi:hypothetical protein